MNLIQPVVYVLCTVLLFVSILCFIIQIPLFEEKIIFTFLLIAIFIFSLSDILINMFEKSKTQKTNSNCQKWDQERNLFVIPNINSNKLSGENKNQSRRKKLFHLMEPEF